MKIQHQETGSKGEVFVEQENERVAMIINDKQNAISGDNHRDRALSCMMRSFNKSCAILPCSLMKIKNKKQTIKTDDLLR